VVLLIIVLLSILAIKKEDNFELVLYTKTGMMVNKQITLGYKSFLILLQEFLGITMTVSNADAELGMSNEIANGGFNGSYATITTKDGLS
jgi:molybdopterin-containing oxidoreductase family iron-sulfur binding subunit